MRRIFFSIPLNLLLFVAVVAIVTLIVGDVPTSPEIRIAPWRLLLLVLPCLFLGFALTGVILEVRHGRYAWRQRGLRPDEPQCSGCGYIVRGLTSSACPECGADLQAAGAIRSLRPCPPPGPGLRWLEWMLYGPAFLLLPLPVISLALPFTHGRYASLTFTDAPGNARDCTLRLRVYGRGYGPWQNFDRAEVDAGGVYAKLQIDLAARQLVLGHLDPRPPFPLHEAGLAAGLACLYYRAGSHHRAVARDLLVAIDQLRAGVPPDSWPLTALRFRDRSADAFELALPRWFAFLYLLLGLLAWAALGRFCVARLKPQAAAPDAPTPAEP